MPKEIKILIPETGVDESVDIRVLKAGKEVVNYRLEVFSYPIGKTGLSRADFVKESIEKYNPSFEVVEIGLDGEDVVPVLFRQVCD